MNSRLDFSFNDDWNKTKLENLIANGSAITYGVVQPGPEVEGGVPFIRGGDIFGGKIAVQNLRTISEDVSRTYQRTLLEGGEILMSLVGYPGEVAIVPEDLAGANIARQAALIKLSPKVDNKYIMYYLLSDFGRFFLFQKSTGSAQQVINLVELKEVKVWFPPKAQQKKIASILSTVDQLIEKTQSLIDKYTAIKQGMMADLFTRGIDLSPGPDGRPESNPKYGKLRPSREQAPELYKETELGWVPKDWEVSKLGDCCIVHNNLRKPISAEEREKIKGDYPYYGCTGVLDFINEFRLDGEYVIIGEDGDHFLKFDRQPMTILVNGKFNVNNHAHVVSGTDKCLTEWFHCYFVHRDITYYLTRQGAGRFKLKKETLLTLPMLLPPSNEQEELYKRYLSVFYRQETEKKALLKYQKIKKGLMQDMLTGKVEVK